MTDWLTHTHRHRGAWTVVLHPHFTSIIPDVSMASVDGMRDPLPSQINGEWPTKFCEKWLENIAIKQETSPLSIQLFRAVEDGVLHYYPEYLLFQWTEVTARSSYMNWQFSKSWYMVNWLSNCSQRWPWNHCRRWERGKWEVSRPAVLFPDLPFYVFCVLGFF